MEGSSEPPQGPEREQGRFATSRDAVLFLLATEGWANASSGDVEAPTGFFSKVVIGAGELDEIVDAFLEEISAEGLTDTRQLIGNFLLMNDDQGVVTVIDYHDEADLDTDYRILEEGYTAWSAQDEADEAPEAEGEPAVTLTAAQETALRALCERYHVEFDASAFHSRFDLPEGYVAGWVSNIYVGCSPEGQISS